MIDIIVGWGITFILWIFRRRVAHVLKKHGVRSFKAPPMTPLMEDSANVGRVWQNQSIMHLHLPSLGDVLVITKGLHASIAMHQMLQAHDWDVDMRGLRERFNSKPSESFLGCPELPVEWLPEEVARVKEQGELTGVTISAPYGLYTIDQAYDAPKEQKNENDGEGRDKIK